MWVLGLGGLTEKYNFLRYFLRPTAIFYQVNSVIMWDFPGSMILRVTPSFHPDNAV